MTSLQELRERIGRQRPDLHGLVPVIPRSANPYYWVWEKITPEPRTAHEYLIWCSAEWREFHARHGHPANEGPSAHHEQFLRELLEKYPAALSSSPTPGGDR